MNNHTAFLTIRFEGPEVKPGRMRLTDFVHAVHEFLTCAQRVGLALQHAPSTVEGRRPKNLTEALSLDLVAFTAGSPAAVAHLERTECQSLLFEDADLGDRAFRLLVQGIDGVGKPEDSLPEGFDIGVLLKLRDFGKLFSKGVSKVEFQINHRKNIVCATYDEPKYERVRQRIAKPDIQQVTLQGRLLMADFKETGRVLRVHPPVGSPVVCHFTDKLSNEVEESIRHYVRVTGKMIYQETGIPKWLELTDIEPLEAPGEDSTLNESAPAWNYGFWENLSAEEYARRQGVEPVTDLSKLHGLWNSDDWNGFDEALERWRSELQPA